MPVPCRLAALGRLERSVRAHQEDIAAALRADLGKSPQESYMCETGLTLAELRDHRAHLRRWAQPRVRLAGAANFPGLAARVPEPYGVALIMAPWNYPFLLTLEPLIGAVAAGNCAVVKPSAYAPASSALLARMIRESFPPGHVTVVEGGRAENTALLDQEFDTIFFTGSVAVGRMVMEKAAAHLTPVTLELGGKSPCIVTADADLALAARRIVFGKLLNCGQTCVAPDYLLDSEIARELTARIKAEIRRQYGPRPLQNPAYGRIVNQKHFRRLCGLLDGASRVWGGERDADAWRIAPALLEDASPREPACRRRSSARCCRCCPTAVWRRPWTLCAAGPSPWPSTCSPAAVRSAAGWCVPCPMGAAASTTPSCTCPTPSCPLAEWTERNGQLPRQAQLRHLHP